MILIFVVYFKKILINYFLYYFLWHWQTIIIIFNLFFIIPLKKLFSKIIFLQNHLKKYFRINKAKRNVISTSLFLWAHRKCEGCKQATGSTKNNSLDATTQFPWIQQTNLGRKNTGFLICPRPQNQLSCHGTEDKVLPLRSMNFTHLSTYKSKAIIIAISIKKKFIFYFECSEKTDHQNEVSFATECY